MMKRLVGQFNIIGKAALSSLAPSLYRLGFVLLGVIIGLLWAYQGAPVKFLDAEPVHLADGYKDQWIKMAAVEYAQSGDADEATRKIVEAGVSPKMIEDLIAANDATDPPLANDLRALLPIAEQNRSAASKQAELDQNRLSRRSLGPAGLYFGNGNYRHCAGYIFHLLLVGGFWNVAPETVCSGTSKRPIWGDFTCVARHRASPCRACCGPPRGIRSEDRLRRDRGGASCGAIHVVLCWRG